MRFTKMHGAGNDYVYVDGFSQPLPDDLPELARRVSDRHFGVGADGLILILPSEAADARMRMFNADGSEAEMCGNGIRCVGKYVYDHGLVQRPSLVIETGAGLRRLDLELADGRVSRVRVDMGEPILDPAEIPVDLPGQRVINVPLDLGDRTLAVTCVSMGNPHCIIFVERLSDDWVLGVGPKVERDRRFPRRTNVEFVETISPSEANVRVWERGSGETLACGTGACAVCVAGALAGRTGRRLLARLPGGELELQWSEEDNHVWMTGPAVEVFSGEWP